MVSTTGLNVELGAGHVIAVRVTLSHPVTVYGTPVVPLSLTHRKSIIDFLSTRPCESAGSTARSPLTARPGNESLMGTVDAVDPEVKIRYAKYTSGSGTTVLTFEHTIRRGDMTGNLDMPEVRARFSAARGVVVFGLGAHG